VRHSERGQALIETVVFLPLFLFVLYGLIWAVKAAVQYERTENAIRYAGLVSQHRDPYEDYSLYAMYKQIGSQVMPTQACIITTEDLSIASAPLSDGAPTYTPPASTSFWSPAITPTPSCAFAGIIGAAGGGTPAQDVLLSLQEPGISSSVAVPSLLAGKLGSVTAPRADGYFFKQVGLDVLLACYPVLNSQIKSALQPLQDGSTSSGLPVPLVATVTATTLASSCNTF
jgi:hypothetical protein